MASEMMERWNEPSSLDILRDIYYSHRGDEDDFVLRCFIEATKEGIKMMSDSKIRQTYRNWFKETTYVNDLLWRKLGD